MHIPGNQGGTPKWNERDADERAFMKKVGERFAFQRKKYRLTQKQVGERIGAPASIISRLETRGESITIDKLAKACILFGCSADYMLGLENVS